MSSPRLQQLQAEATQALRVAAVVGLVCLFTSAVALFDTVSGAWFVPDLIRPWLVHLALGLWVPTGVLVRRYGERWHAVVEGQRRELDMDVDA